MNGRRLWRRVAGWAVLVGLFCGGAHAQEILILSSGIKGLRAHRGDPQKTYLVLPEGLLKIPVQIPPGRVQVQVTLHSNGQGKEFRKTRVHVWYGPFAGYRSVAEIALGTTVDLSFVARAISPPVLHLYLDLPTEARNEYLKLKQDAGITAPGGAAPAAGLDDIGDAIPGLGEMEQELTVLDATKTKLPMVLLESIRVTPLPPPVLVPEIANVVPYIRVHSPSMVLGENLDGDDPLEVRTWQPPAGEAEVRAGAAALAAGTPPALPPEPPADAKVSELLDRDVQLVMAELPGDAVWVRNRHGWSKPYLCRRAAPFWVSVDEANPGEELIAYGYALRSPGGPAYVLLRAGETVHAAEIHSEPPCDDHGDRYLVRFRVPTAVPPGEWELWFNNAAAGRYGWVRGPSLKVVAPRPDPKVLTVTNFGADGLDEQSDREAIVKALQAAVDAGGGVVDFPPGRYLVDETVTLPAGVSLRGAGHGRTTLEGFGFDPTAVDHGSEIQCQAVAPLLAFRDRTGVSHMTLRGAVARGPNGWYLYPMLSVHGAREVRIEHCEIHAPAEDPETLAPLYGYAIWIRNSRHVRLADNRLLNGVAAHDVQRFDMVRNRIREALNSVVSADLGRVWDSRIDSNVIAELTARWCPIAGGAHNLYRRNQLHHKFVGEVASEEGYLFHGSIPAGMSPEQIPEQADEVKTATARSLTAAHPFRHTDAEFRGRSLVGATVQIVSGRGFGQYRVVTDNTDDRVTVDRPWEVIPDATSWFTMKSAFTENALVGNWNNAHSPNCFYYDQIGSIVEHHRSRGNYTYLVGDNTMGRGPGRVPLDRSSPGVSYFNLFCDWDYLPGYFNLNGCQQGEPLREQAPFFANFFVSNQIATRTRCVGVGEDGFGVIGREEGINWPGESHTVFADNEFRDAAVGMNNGILSKKTLLWRNRFVNVGRILVDAGGETILRGNRRVTTGPGGTEQVEPIPDAVNPNVIVPWQRGKLTREGGVE